MNMASVQPADTCIGTHQSEADESIKILNFGVELGVSMNCGVRQTLEILNEGLRQDELEEIQAKTNVVDSIPDSDEAGYEPSTPTVVFAAQTPTAVFLPIEYWSDSQIRDDILQQPSASLSLSKPPGFENFLLIPPGFEVESEVQQRSNTSKGRRRVLRAQIFEVLVGDQPNWEGIPLSVGDLLPHV